MAFPTFLAVADLVPNTSSWSPLVAVVMIISNVLAIAIANYVASNRKDGGASAQPAVGGMGLPNLLGAVCFGHILGTGTILALASAGIL